MQHGNHQGHEKQHFLPFFLQLRMLWLKVLVLWKCIHTMLISSHPLSFCSPQEALSSHVWPKYRSWNVLTIPFMAMSNRSRIDLGLCLSCLDAQLLVLKQWAALREQWLRKKTQWFCRCVIRIPDHAHMYILHTLLSQVNGLAFSEVHMTFLFTYVSHVSHWFK